MTRTQTLRRLRRDFQTGKRGHLNIGDEDIGPGLLHRAQCFIATARPGDNLDVVFHLEQSSECTQNHGLVFGNDDTNFVALAAGHLLSFAEQRQRVRAVNE